MDTDPSSETDGEVICDASEEESRAAPLETHSQNGAEGSSEWDQERLKRLILALKKKHEATVAQLTEESKVLQGQQVLLKQLLEQAHRDGEKTRQDLEKALLQLEKRGEEGVASELIEEVRAELAHAQMALRSSQRDQKVAEELLAEERQNAEMHKVRLEKLGVAIKERDKRIADLHHFEYSYRKAYEHKQHIEGILEQESHAKHLLKEQCEALSGKLAKQEKDTSAVQCELQRILLQLSDLEGQVLLSQQQSEEYKNASTLLQRQLESERVAASGAQQAAKQAQQRQLIAQEELTAMQEQFKQLKARTIAAQQELKLKESALLETHQIIEQLKFENQNLQKVLSAESTRAQGIQKELANMQNVAAGWHLKAQEGQAALALTQEELEIKCQHIASIEELLASREASLTEQDSELSAAASWRAAAEKLLSEQGQIISGLMEEKGTLSMKLADSVQQGKALEITHEALKEETARSYESQAAGHAATVEHLQGYIGELEAGLQQRDGELARWQESHTEHLQLKLCYEAIEEQLKTALQAIATLENREGQYQKAIDNLDEGNALLHGELKEQAEALSQLEEALRASEGQNQDKDMSLKLAQHHLAKKVKDYGAIEEKYSELQQTLLKMELHIEEMGKKGEEQRIAARQQDELHAENKRQAEAHIREWERKYFEKDEAWQQSERRCQQEREQVLEVEKKLERCMQRLQKFMHLEIMLRDFGFGSAQSLMEAAEPQMPSISEGAPLRPAVLPASQLEAPKGAISPLTVPPQKHESLFENAFASKHKDHLFD